MSFRVSRIDLEGEGLQSQNSKEPLAESVSLLATAYPPRSTRRQSSLAELSEQILDTPPAEPIEERESGLTTGRARMRSVFRADPVLIGSIYGPRFALTTVLDSDPISFSPTNTAKLSVENDNSIIFNGTPSPTMALHMTEAISVDPIQLERLTESPTRPAPLETFAESICIGPSLDPCKVLVNQNLEIHICEATLCFPADRSLEIQSLNPIELINEKDERKARDEDLKHFSALYEITEHPKCPAYIKRIAFEHFPGRFPEPTADTMKEVTRDSLDHILGRPNPLRRSATSVDLMSEVHSPLIIRSTLLLDETEPTTLSVNMNFRAVAALRRLQRKARRRYQNQREELINALGL